MQAKKACAVPNRVGARTGQNGSERVEFLCCGEPGVRGEAPRSARLQSGEGGPGCIFVAGRARTVTDALRPLCADAWGVRPARAAAWRSCGGCAWGERRRARELHDAPQARGKEPRNPGVRLNAYWQPHSPRDSFTRGTARQTAPRESINQRISCEHSSGAIDQAATSLPRRWPFLPRQAAAGLESHRLAHLARQAHLPDDLSLPVHLHRGTGSDGNPARYRQQYRHDRRRLLRTLYRVVHR